MKEQAISFQPPIYILCYHPLASRIIKTTLAPCCHCIHLFSEAQIQGLAKHEYILIIDTCSVERWLEMTLRYGLMKKQPVILLTHDLTPLDEIRVLYLGVRGIVPIANIETELTPAVESILSKRLWISRNTLTKYVVQRDGLVNPSPKCTSREQQVMACLMESFSNKEIGQMLEISPRTVKFHVGNILRKFSVKNRRDLLGIQNSKNSRSRVKEMPAKPVSINDQLQNRLA